MSKAELDNLVVKVGSLKAEAYEKTEYDGLVRSAQKRLSDARNDALAPESRFDLAYNAAHSLALAALRYNGYRPNKNRHVVFLALVHTTDLTQSDVRVLSKSHDNRNLAEYEGESDVNPKLLTNLINIATKLEAAVLKFQVKRK